MAAGEKLEDSLDVKPRSKHLPVRKYGKLHRCSREEDAFDVLVVLVGCCFI